MGRRIKHLIFIFLIFGSGFYTVDYFVKRYEIQRYQTITAEYGSLNCENMKARFEIDLKQHQLKYFSFGMFDSEKFNRNLKNLGIENLHQGCVLSPLNCYNKFVEHYLLKSRNKNILDLY